jgi:predicted ATP-dependent endonuclease of OLD family
LKISSVHVKNFRCLRDATLSCDDLTVLVGKNGSGKSSFLRALDIFYSPAAQYTEEDFYNRNTNQPIRIQVTFADLSKKEREIFRTYIDDDTLTVEKELTWPRDRQSQKYYGMRLRNTDFNEVRMADSTPAKREAYRRLREQDKYRESLPELRGNVAGSRIDEELEKWEEEHPDQLTRVRDEGQFFGFREVGQARLEKFTRFIHAPAVRDAGVDAVEGKGSLITEIMDIVVRSSLDTREDLRQFREETQKKYEKMLDPSRIDELQRLAQDMTDTLRIFAPNARIQIRWEKEEAIDIPLPKAYVQLEEDGYQSSVDRVGHGLQRAFIFAALQQLAIAQQLQTGPGEVTEGAGDDLLPHIIIGIEEPELYQHPSRQRHLAKILLELTSKGLPGVASNVQILYTTHSPLLVDLQRFHQVRVLRKEAGPDAQSPGQTKVYQASIEQVTRDLEKADDRSSGSYQSTGTAARLQTLMTPWTNEGFFAEKVVLVEGESDRAAILVQAAIMGYDFESEDIAVIPCIGKTNLLKAAAIFRQYRIPVYVVWDSDMGKSDPKIEVNRSIMRFFGYEPEDYPHRVEERFACFEKDLASTLKEEISEEIYNRLCQECAQEFGFVGRDDALKNPLVMKEVLRRAKNEFGKESHTLKQIVEKIISRTIQEA